MKRKIAALAIAAGLLALSSCGSGTEPGAETDNVQESKSSEVTATVAPTAGEQDSAGALEWPEEFAKWDVPIVEGAALSSATNVSATSSGLAQGENVVVTLAGLSQEDFDAYVLTLEASGFIQNEEQSLAGIMLVYDRDTINMILMYDAETTTITANNSAAAAENEANAGGSAEWPESLAEVPVFTKGAYRDTIDMGGGMYCITFLEVTESDLDWYRGELASAGFESQENEDTEGYAKFTASAAYSVGFSCEDGTLQIIALSATY